MSILNAVKSYHDIAQTEGKAARKEWCRKHFLNERTFLEAMNIRDQLRQTCGRLGIDWKTSAGDEEGPILRSLAHGLVQNSAFIQPDGSYKQTMAQSVCNPRTTLEMLSADVPFHHRSSKFTRAQRYVTKR